LSKTNDTACRLVVLSQRHEALKNKIKNLFAHSPGYPQEKLHGLKREKLRLKDLIQKLQPDHSQRVSCAA